jgi:hypothetical protein
MMSKRDAACHVAGPCNVVLHDAETVLYSPRQGDIMG